MVPHRGDRPAERDAALRQWAAVEVQGYKPRSPLFGLGRLRALWREARAGFDAARREDPRAVRVDVAAVHRIDDAELAELAGELRIVSPGADVESEAESTRDEEDSASIRAGVWLLRAMVALRRCMRGEDGLTGADDRSLEALEARVRAARDDGLVLAEEADAALGSLAARRDASPRCPIEEAHHALGRMCMELGIITVLPSSGTVTWDEWREEARSVEERERQALRAIVDALRPARRRRGRDEDERAAYRAIELYAGVSEGTARRLAAPARARMAGRAGS